MQELEKILEDMKKLRGQVGSECTSEDHYIKRTWEHCLDRVEDIIRKHMPGKDIDVPANDGWIPVEEKLPEDDSMVLVTCRTKKGVLSVNRAYCDGAFWHGCGSMSGVTAWMPLPEPYRPERSDNYDGE